MGEGRTSTPVTEVDVLIKMHIERLIERFKTHGDVSIAPEWNPRGGGRPQTTTFHEMERSSWRL